MGGASREHPAAAVFILLTVLAACICAAAQDMMSRLHGGWHFKQLEPPSKGSVGSTEVTYTFAMWPKGKQAGTCAWSWQCQAAAQGITRVPLTRVAPMHMHMH